MVTFSRFQPAAPIPEDTIARFAPHAPEGAVEMWRQYGTGVVGDGFVRVVDPARAAQMTAGLLQLPRTAVILFSTALADLVIWGDGTFLVAKFRWGVVQFTESGMTLEQLAEWLQDEQRLDETFERQPYPGAAARDGVPGVDECYGFVPLLALGGANSADHLQKMALWEHIELILQLTEPPRITGLLVPPPEPQQGGGADDVPTPEQQRLIDVGVGYWRRMVPEDAPLAYALLPEDDAVVVSHTVRGGGRIYVAPDGSALFAGSGAPPHEALEVFRSGRRTPLENFRPAVAAPLAPSLTDMDRPALEQWFAERTEMHSFGHREDFVLAFGDGETIYGIRRTEEGGFALLRASHSTLRPVAAATHLDDAIRLLAVHVLDVGAAQPATPEAGGRYTFEVAEDAASLSWTGEGGERREVRVWGLEMRARLVACLARWVDASLEEIEQGALKRDDSPPRGR
jgi:hypothetical protein